MTETETIARYRAALDARATVRQLLAHAQPEDDRLAAACQAFLASTAHETSLR